MNNHVLPPELTNPAAAAPLRNQVLGSYYFFNQDFDRAMHYSLAPLLAGNPWAMMKRLETLTVTRRFEAVWELAAIILALPLSAPVRMDVLGLAAYAGCYLGARNGDCSGAYRLISEMSGYANINPHCARWTGQPIGGKSLLLTLLPSAFIGFGDHIVWARFVPEVAALGARIVVQGPAVLHRLFLTLPGVVAVCDYEHQPQCDFASTLMELPHVLGLRGFPTLNPFNVAAAQIPERGHKVGIAWGTSWTSPLVNRSCALAELLPVARIRSARLYSFQKGPQQRQLYPAPRGMTVHDLAPELRDFRDTAAQLAAMDVVVTTDNVLANLACTIGRPTFVLVPKFADWRWGEGGQAPWYPSARVYQQEVAGEWDVPIARLTADLRCYLREHGRKLCSAAESVQVGPSQANEGATTASGRESVPSTYDLASPNDRLGALDLAYAEGGQR
jgi:hypothetical protein